MHPNINNYKKPIIIGAFVIAVIYGFYYTQVMVPYRQANERISETLTTLRLKSEDKLEICMKDPNLQNQDNILKMNQLQQETKDIAYKLIEHLTYGGHILPSKVSKDFTDFLHWNWRVSDYIDDHKSCPSDFRNHQDGMKLKEWQNRISREMPTYWFF